MIKEMTSMQRFDAVCKYVKPERFPIDFIAHDVVTKSLKKYLGISTEHELLDALKCDFFYLPGRDISQNEGYLRVYKGKKLYMDDTEYTSIRH